jgi:hypothetical protein
MIALTAYREQDEPWRIERLKTVAQDCAGTVLALHDHKGTLSINWSAPPKINDLTAMVQAWALQGEWSINHYVCGAEIAIDCGDANPFVQIKMETE